MKLKLRIDAEINKPDGVAEWNRNLINPEIN